MEASANISASHQADATWWFSYWRCPVFTWQWFARRTGVFALIALVTAAASALNVAVLTSDLTLAVTEGCILLGVDLVKLTVGGFMATAVRERRLPIHMERIGIVAAVLLGTWLCTVMQKYWQFYYVENVLRQMAKGGWVGDAVLVREKPLGVILYTRLSSIWLHFWFSGGLALRSYFVEQRHLMKTRQQQELKELRLRISTSDQQLAILQAQIEPHFLFNTLATVRSLVTQDQQRAAALIDGLASYLRVTMPKLRNAGQTSTLGEQLEICASYLELIRLRMGERFSFSMAVDSSLFSVSVPPLLLLPLIENAVTHGIEPKAGNVAITLAARSDDDLLRISIDDDGVGLRVDAAVQETGKGIGLANIRSQLNLRYGKSAQLDVSSRNGGGTSAILLLPIERAG